MLANPFTRPLGEWSNEHKRSLSENPDVGFAGGRLHRFPIRSSEVCIEAIAHIFPCAICSRMYSGGEAIGEEYETAHYGSRAHLTFCVPSRCRRAFSTRARHGLLAWRRFRRECSLERRTAK